MAQKRDGMRKAGRQEKRFSEQVLFLLRNNNSFPPPLPHTKNRWGGGALLSCFPAFLINQENRRGRREAD
jgi:hypothetical protein